MSLRIGAVLASLVSGSLSGQKKPMANHRKRPRDANQLGKLIVDISTGEIDDKTSLSRKAKITRTIKPAKKAGGRRRGV